MAGSYLVRTARDSQEPYVCAKLLNNCGVLGWQLGIAEWRTVGRRALRSAELRYAQLLELDSEHKGDLTGRFELLDTARQASST